ADTYQKVLSDFPSGAYRELANQRIFDIANFWLDDTRAQMEAERERKEGKRWFVMPASFVHFERTKPFLDEEGRAIEKLEQVHIHDPRGALGEKALFYLGSVKFYHEDYREADHYFYKLVTDYPNSALAPQALELAIICKQLSTGGSAYDGRRCVEARMLVDKALRAYPELAAKKDGFLKRQLVSI